MMLYHLSCSWKYLIALLFYFLVWSVFSDFGFTPDSSTRPPYKCIYDRIMSRLSRHQHNSPQDTGFTHTLTYGQKNCKYSCLPNFQLITRWEEGKQNFKVSVRQRCRVVQLCKSTFLNCWLYFLKVINECKTTPHRLSLILLSRVNVLPQHLLRSIFSSLFTLHGFIPPVYITFCCCTMQYTL